jgi:Holliday junction resolvase-like predicted endonuclease
LEQNWRTRWCEIDLIATKRHVVYFVEVKYRRNTAFGGGLEYITPRKLAQMHFAAEFWISRNQKVVGDYRLAAMEVTGQDYTVTEWMDTL